MNKFLVSLSLMMCICISYAQIYKWTDSQGNVHFSDTPHEGAEIITIPEEQSYSSPNPSSTSTPKEEDEQPVKLKHTYTKIEIAQPKPGATIRNNQGFVEISVEVEPELFPGDQLQLIYDNAPLGKPQTNPLFEVNGMYRGSHTFAVQIVDADENVLETSEPITIYVFRPRVGMVPGTKPH
ncbi:DUF4124 domain-containing protein [Fluoribacter dumoffii]|nr:DUF4124 domain-containing protein [Fluoribacter dumoffii]MCW8385821.1 DUF4124 domain-containing protein [Fluoribacter dumoffii]MCW8418854.1 DUF4124 domain-containing protein [Fluoribacter dumoffii]MCW8453302.1 DUF4124 domain-containing protein [Fluoribacter dumoffii]MCW8459477.1 DUF4124 domain-containing protein [Fluoribacter dumoffii]MCW8482837.1 DUF4124 domain-containing protein [Fluoribacter dumoffii]